MEQSCLLMTLLSLEGIGRRKAELIYKHISGLESRFAVLAVKQLLPARITGEAVDAAAARAAESIGTCVREGWQIVNKYDSSYPGKFSGIADMPLVLYSHGNLSALQRTPAVAVVGAREATEAALEIAYHLGKRLAEIAVSVVSGLALGCDTAAHRGCLSSNGYTAAILPSGLDVIYPAQNSVLAAEIARYGCLISEYPPGVRPARFRFVERDRLQSGLSDFVIVVQTTETGGAMYTANFARRQGRRVLVFSPGCFGDSEQVSGNKRLIASGAQEIRSVDEAVAFVQSALQQQIQKSTLF